MDSTMECECGNSPVVRIINDAPCCHDCAKELRMPELLTRLGVLPKFHKARLWESGVNIPTELLDKSLFITGNVGTGKTHYSVALLTDYIKNVPFSEKLSCDFTTMVDLLEKIKATFSGPSDVQLKLITHYQTVDYLVIDDIGVEQASDWAMVQVYRIINHRWGCDKQTIFTSNFNYAQLAEKLDSRIVSRIMGMCQIVQLDGADLRKGR